MKAIWNNQVIAESDKTLVIEGNHYFPPESINKDFFVRTDTRTTCFWKGEAHYYSIQVDGKVNEDAAWYYPETKKQADGIKNYVAFWKGVTVEA